MTEPTQPKSKPDDHDIDMALRCLSNAYDTLDVLIKALDNEPNLSDHVGYSMVAETVREHITGATQFLEGRLR